MSGRSFAFFSMHYIFVVLMQYLMSGVLAGSTLLLFVIPVICSYVLTFLSVEVFVRVPVLCFLTGIKAKRRDNAVV